MAAYLPPFLAFGSFRNWLKLLGENGRIDKAYWPRALFITLSTLSMAPLRGLERLRYNRRVRSTPLDVPPVFIVGHFRSGTTHLHNLIVQDQQFGYLPFLESAMPEFYLLGAKTIKPLMAKIMPSMRPMDNVPFTIESPQEEEFALANMSPYSSYHLLSFPQNARFYFDKYALLRDLPPQVIDQWKATYSTLLQKIALANDGKPLLLKNPANTGRLSLLRELFPEAKFIHIHRNPYHVFLSTINLYKRLLPLFELQKIDADQIEQNALYFYCELMQKFSAEAALIPPENLVEVGFDQLIEAPLAELQRIYEQLDLGGFATAEPQFRAYIDSQADYQKNQYNLTDKVVDTVNGHWSFAFDRWGYDMRRSPTTPAPDANTATQEEL